MEQMFRQRMEFVTSPGSEECFLCLSGGSSDDEENLVLSRSRWCLVVLNRFPYNTGHLMVSPLRHVGDIEALSKDERDEIMDLSIKCLAALREAFEPQGFNIGANLGEAAGAGIPGHFHMHVVPRWTGDTNFMPVLGDAKVLPEPLRDTYRRLKPMFEDLGGGA